MLSITILLSWFACLGTYLSSDKQKLLNKPLAKKQSWLFSSISLLVTWYLATYAYSITTAFLYVLSLMMLSWIVIIVLRGHWRYSSTSFALGGAALLLALLNLGNI